MASDRRHLSSEDVIRSCVTNALIKAAEAGCSSVAMPVFGTGHAHVRFDRALAAMASALAAAANGVEHVTVVVPARDRAEAARHAFITNQP